MDTGIEKNGINYDSGTNLAQDAATRVGLRADAMRREIGVTKNDLHCDSIRIYGDSIDKLRSMIVMLPGSSKEDG
ncbi:MAG: hypothetical protein WCE82_10270 [Halobacteriota archaeon]